MIQKRQQKFKKNFEQKVETIEKHSGVKLSKKSSEEVRADNEELIAAMSRIATSGSAAHELAQT